MENSIRIFDAIDFATKAHNGQIRKTNGLPKILHPYGVAMLLSQYGYSEDVIIAGLLHDVIEDCKDYSREDIVTMFGEKVASYVDDVTEPSKSIDWKTRKLTHIQNIQNVCFESKVLCSADKIHNLYSLEKDLRIQGDVIWDKFNASRQDVCWYYLSMCDSIVKGYEDKNIPIFNLLQGTVDRVIKGGNSL